MANIQKIENKKGISYKITVCLGYDIKGKKVTKSTTFRPDPLSSPKQQKKELDKFVLDFEDKVKNGDCFSGEKIMFEDFTEEWLKHVKNNLTYGAFESYNLNSLESYTNNGVSKLKASQKERCCFVSGNTIFSPLIV